MRRKKVHGQCHLCGSNGRLTFEHVPPQSAFNNVRILKADIDRLINSDDSKKEIENPKGEYVQGGAGSYTLCKTCNNDTGSWYASDYVEFVKAVFPLCRQAPKEARVSFRAKMRPLRVLKQILVMFCSACPPGFAAKHPDLVRYLLNRTSREFPPGIQVWASLFDTRNSRATRQSGISGRLDLDAGTSIYSEISFPPFNFVMTLDGSRPPDTRLANIDFMHEFEYSEHAEVTLSLYNLSVNTYFPGDYRTLDQLPSKSNDADIT